MGYKLHFFWLKTIISIAKKGLGEKTHAQSITRLLVSGRSPECSDCLLRHYGAVITIKIKCIKIKRTFFFLKFEIFYENHPPTRHIK